MTAIEIACPLCQVRAGRPCLDGTRTGERIWSYTTAERPHAERVEAAEARTRLVREERAE